MGYPVAYLSGNTTTYETGMFKRGTIGQNQAAALTGNYRWWNGIDVTSSQYLIYSDTFTTSASTAANATPAAWATPDLADQSLLNLINTLPERIGKLPFTYLPVALQWIQSTGRYFLLRNGYENIVTNGLKGRGSAFLYRFPVDFIIILTFCVRLRLLRLEVASPKFLNYNKLLVAFRHCSPAATTHDHTSSSPVLKRSPCHLQPLLCSASYFTNTKINDGH